MRSTQKRNRNEWSGNKMKEHIGRDETFSRTRLLLGEEGMKRLADARVAVFGVGGVGGYVVEALARSGVGTLDLIDHDRVSESNINRQIIAIHRTVGYLKVEVARERILEINPEAEVHIYPVFYLPETAKQFDFTAYDYVVDAIDTVTGKLALAEQAYAAGTPIISSMGAGNKLDASAFRVADIYQTSVCPLAKVMRRELKKRGIPKLKVVYSQEQPRKPLNEGGEDTVKAEATKKRQIPGSTAFVPSVAGLIIAGEVVRDLTGVS